MRRHVHRSRLWCAIVLGLVAFSSTARAEDGSSSTPQRRFGVRSTVVSSHEISRKEVPGGTAVELDLLVRLRTSQRTRIDLGLEGRTYTNIDARHHSLGPIVEGVIEASRYFELTFTLAPHHTWIDFKSPFWEDTRAFGARTAMNGQLILVDRVVVIFSPLAANLTRSDSVRTLFQWEPRIGAGLLF